MPLHTLSPELLAALAAAPAPICSLNLSHNALTDLAPLRALPHLTRLDASFNALAAAAGLSALTALTALRLRGNPLAARAGYHAEVARAAPWVAVLDGAPLEAGRDACALPSPQPAKGQQLEFVGEDDQRHEEGPVKDKPGKPQQEEQQPEDQLQEEDTQHDCAPVEQDSVAADLKASSDSQQSSGQQGISPLATASSCCEEDASGSGTSRRSADDLLPLLSSQQQPAQLELGSTAGPSPSPLQKVDAAPAEAAAPAALSPEEILRQWRDALERAVMGRAVAELQLEEERRAARQAEQLLTGRLAAAEDRIQDLQATCDESRQQEEAALRALEVQKRRAATAEAEAARLAAACTHLERDRVAARAAAAARRAHKSQQTDAAAETSCAESRNVQSTPDTGVLEQRLRLAALEGALEAAAGEVAALQGRLRGAEAERDAAMEREGAARKEAAADVASARCEEEVRAGRLLADAAAARREGARARVVAGQLELRLRRLRRKRDEAGRAEEGGENGCGGDDVAGLSRCEGEWDQQQQQRAEQCHASGSQAPLQAAGATTPSRLGRLERLALQLMHPPGGGLGL
jgi:hypothetical protein